MIPPKPYNIKHTKKRICVIDTETDPFKQGRKVAPFCLGFYDTRDEIYKDFWGVDCVAQFFAWLAQSYERGECLIYAHNGGKFDFFFLLDYMDMGQEPSIINGRLVSVFFGGHEFRCSFAIIPEKLSAYQKDEIDYALFEANTREQNKREILTYLKGDCIYLGQLVCAFHEMFGDRLTIGSTALPMLHSFHGFEQFGQRDDAFFRRFYFGGRVECFEVGNLKGDWKVYDVNSMYPYVMANMRHPVGRDFVVRSDVTDKVHFAHISAYSEGALPAREADGSLSFPCARGDYFATGHEIRAGLDTGRLRIDRVHSAYQFKHETTFADFVDHFYNMRLKAKEQASSKEAEIARIGKVNNIFFKLVLNSAYGKFAQDPEKYCDYYITRGELPDDDRGIFDESTNPKGWNIESYYGHAIIWRASTEDLRGYKNVAAAASITGAARAVLLRGIHNAKRPVYCDTDAIICEALSDVEIHPTILGAWDLEKEGDFISIAGKKLYTIFKDGSEVKKASKGVNLTGEQIKCVAGGGHAVSIAEVPTFKRDKKHGFGAQIFTDRNVKRTGKAKRVSR